MSQRRRLNHSLRWYSINEVPEPKKKVMGLVNCGNNLIELHTISLDHEDLKTKRWKIGRDMFEGIKLSTYTLKSNYPEMDIRTRCGKGKGPWGGNDERVDELNGQGNDQGLRANGGVEGVNGNVERVNGGVGGAPDFSKIIAQQLQNHLPAMLAQVGNQENVENQNVNVVNENIQENVGNVIVNGNWVGCSYKEFLACN
nr:hypothetical protein [Tanacetum cinerariifolium]